MGREESVTERLVDKRKIGLTVALFTFTYLVSYLTRINYGAVVTEMVRETGMAKAELSAALTGSFITYGVGQLISGWFGDRIQPKYLVLMGLLTTSAMNLLLPFCGNAALMTSVWCVNGFAQALMWPPIVKLMAALFSPDVYRRATVMVSLGGALGTMTIYLVSPLCISLAGWRSVFWVCAVCGLVMAALWQKGCCRIPMEPLQQNNDAPTPSSLRLLFRPMMLCILLCIVLQGALRDGVTTWMPSYIADTYNLSTVVSILTGVVMPIFTILSNQIASACYRKTASNPLRCGTLFFGIGAVSALLLALLFSKNPLISVVLSALLTGSMHSVNLMLVCMIPAFFQRFGKVSTVSGLLNSCTYIGSAVSTYGIALLSEGIGWQPTIVLWFGIAAAGTLLCAACIPAWKRFFR